MRADDLQKSPGTGGAFFTHQKIGNPALGSDFCSFRKLPADIDDRSRCGEKTVAAFGLTGNVGNLPRGKRRAFRAESRDHQAGELLHRDTGTRVP